MLSNGAAKTLDGVRILELARWQAAPRGGLILQDMGAEVIKLEWRKGADLRASGPFVGGMSVQFAAYNRGKKSVTLNSRHEKGKELFFRLLEVSDVVLENFRPGTMERMGFGYEEMCKVNPGIILASVSGFGQYGPYRDRQCFDPIIQAMSGFGDQTGRGFGEPIMGNGPVMDRTAALHAVIGILGALRHRDRTGEGQWLEVAMLDGGITLEEVALAMCYETNTNDFVRVGTFLKCTDGWVTTGAARAGMWERMLKLMDYDELAEDPEFAAPMFATDMAQIRMELLRMWCEERTVKEVEGGHGRLRHTGRCGQVHPRGPGRQPYVGAGGDDGSRRPRAAGPEGPRPRPDHHQVLQDAHHRRPHTTLRRAQRRDLRRAAGHLRTGDGKFGGAGGDRLMTGHVAWTSPSQ